MPTPFIDGGLPLVREILIRLTVVDHEVGNVLATLMLDAEWPDSLVGVQVVEDRPPRGATSEEAESMCWIEDGEPNDPNPNTSPDEQR